MIKSVLAAAFGAACFLGTMGSAGSADAQGTMDCRRPNQPYQRVVCSDPALKAADVRLFETLNAALRVVSNPDSLRFEQTEWTQNLRNCSGDIPCLRDFYTDRTGTLNQRMRWAAEEEAEAATVEEAATPSTTPTVGNAPEPVPTEDPAPDTLISPDTGPVESEDLPPVVDAGQAVATSETTSSQELVAAPTASRSPAWSIPPWVMISAGISLFLLVGLSIHILNVSAERYGYDMMFNRMAPLHIVVAACVWLSFLVPLLFAPIALLTFGVILFNNIRRTSLLIGLAGSLIQPFALVLTFMGAKWLATALRPKK